MTAKLAVVTWNCFPVVAVEEELLVFEVTDEVEEVEPPLTDDEVTVCEARTVMEMKTINWRKTTIMM